MPIVRGYVSVEEPSKEDKEFWEKVLHDHRLGMGRGRRNWLVYGHDDFDLDTDESPEDTE
jgi:hypothetical protein